MLFKHRRTHPYRTTRSSHVHFRAVAAARAPAGSSVKSVPENKTDTKLQKEAAKHQWEAPGLKRHRKIKKKKRQEEKNEEEEEEDTDLKES